MVDPVTIMTLLNPVIARWMKSATPSIRTTGSILQWSDLTMDVKGTMSPSCVYLPDVDAAKVSLGPPSAWVPRHRAHDATSRKLCHRRGYHVPNIGTAQTQINLQILLGKNQRLMWHSTSTFQESGRHVKYTKSNWIQEFDEAHHWVTSHILETRASETC